jgi:hypothetical protein
MANWCDNHLIIMVPAESMSDTDADAASSAELERFKKALDESGKGLMETFLPMPEKYNDTVSDRANSVTADDVKTWRDWQVENWGVKWGDSYLKVFDIDEDNEQLELIFGTRWNLPVAGLAAISKLFPTLEFLDDWEEETPSKGYLLVRDGEVAWSVARVPPFGYPATQGGQLITREVSIPEQGEALIGEYYDERGRTRLDIPHVGNERNVVLRQLRQAVGNNLGEMGLTYPSGLSGSKAKAIKQARECFERQVKAMATSDHEAYEAATRVPKRTAA